jgi:hypothetical protein
LVQPLFDTNKTARNAYIKARKMGSSGWVSVEDSKPKNGELVNVSNIDDGWVCSGSRLGKKWFNQFSSDVIYPTHWQPLPSPPKTEV